MKWFKHETSAHTNLKLQAVIEKFGMAGYGYYWACVELVGLQGTEFKIKSDKNWRIYLKKQSNIEDSLHQELVNFFAEQNLIDKKSLQKGDLFIPKLKERSDEYTAKVRRKSGHGTDNIPLEENRTEEEQKIIDKIPEVIKAFEKINPICKKYYGVPVQRGACYFLISEYGFDRVLGIVEKVLPRTNGMEYFPQITTPVKLQEKWPNLEAAIKREMSRSNKEAEKIGKSFW